MSVEPRWFVGVDVGAENHEVMLLDEHGTQVGARKCPHQATDLLGLVEWVHERCQGEMDLVAIGVESPHGPVVEAFLLAGASVFAINPKQLDRFRDRYSMAGAKDDRRDALVAAEALRTDRARFSRVQPAADENVELRELGRLRKRLSTHFTALANQLRATLLDSWPDLLRLSPAANESWLWALLRRAPTPDKARRLHRKSLGQLLRQHRIRRFDVSELREILQQPSVPVSRGVLKARTYEIELLIEQLELVNRQLIDTTKLLTRQLNALRDNQSAEAEKKGAHRPGDAEIILSFPGAGVLVTSSLIGEAPHCLRDYQLMRCLSGVAPVTKQSGKQRYVIRRFACNHRLQDTIQHWARNAVNNDERLKQHSKQIRARGHGYRRALRQVGDKLLRTLAAALNNGTLYQADYQRTQEQAA